MDGVQPQRRRIDALGLAICRTRHALQRAARVLRVVYRHGAGQVGVMPTYQIAALSVVGDAAFWVPVLPATGLPPAPA